MKLFLHVVIVHDINNDKNKIIASIIITAVYLFSTEVETEITGISHISYIKNCDIFYSSFNNTQCGYTILIKTRKPFRVINVNMFREKYLIPEKYALRRALEKNKAIKIRRRL